MSSSSHLAHSLHTAAHNDGVAGALGGAMAVPLATTMAIGLAGLALTPVGWVVLGTAGAVAGGTGLIKKVFGS